MDMKDITPEMAAQVVKNYLLPMFDSDNKRKGRMKSTLAKEEISEDPAQKPKTIYGELKLSDQLVTQIDRLRKDLDSTKSKLESKCIECEKLQSKAAIIEKEK